MGGCTPATFGFVVSVVVFIISTSLIISSVQKLPPNYYGIDFNKNTNKVSRGTVYGPGRYVLGVGHDFIRFPSTLQSVEFGSGSEADGGSLSVFSSDGQTLFVDLSFQYRLVKEEVQELYSLYGKQFEAGFVRISQSAIKNTAVQFNTTSFFRARRTIADAMLKAIGEVLRDQHALAVAIQLRNIGLPPAFEQAFVDTLVANELEKTNRNVQQIEVVLSQIDVINGAADADVQLTLAQADSQAFQTIAQAQADALGVLVGAESTGVSGSMAALRFNTTDMLTFLWARALRDTKKTIMIGLNSEFSV